MRKLTLLASALILPLTITACDYEGLPFGNKKAQKDETSTSTDGSEANGGPVAMTGADEQAESSAPPLPKRHAFRSLTSPKMNGSTHASCA